MTQPSNEEIRRQLGSMPVAENDLSEYEFKITHRAPVETKPSESDYDPDAWVALLKWVD
jgi:hypothetical protein